MPVAVADARRLLTVCGYGDGPPPAVDARLAQLALVEALGPALGYRLRREEITCTDAAAAAHLVAAYEQCKVRAAITEVLLEPVLGRLATACIPVVLLKGAALARSVYRDIGERWMSDVDVLVPLQSWSEVGELLAAAGAVRQGCPARAVTVASFHEAHFMVNSAVSLDVHRRLHFAGMYSVDDAAVIARSRATTGIWRLPAVEDLLVHLATHAAQDGFVLQARTLLDGVAWWRWASRMRRRSWRGRVSGAGRRRPRSCCGHWSRPGSTATSCAGRRASSGR